MKLNMIVGCVAVALMNVVFMVAELMAGRLAAPWIGVSSYTWISLTVLALAGCAAGNALADTLSRRVRPWRIVAFSCLVAGIQFMLLSPVNDALGKGMSTFTWAVPVRAFVHMAALFLPPALVMGLGTPSILAAVVRDGKSGQGIGTIYACGMAGCVGGSLLAGLVLPGWLATDTIFLSAGSLLAILGGMLAWGVRRRTTLARAGNQAEIMAEEDHVSTPAAVEPDFPTGLKSIGVVVVAAVAMAVEMAAAKQVAPVTGASHVVWGVLFGVFIGGMGAGGWWGGWFADRASLQRWGCGVYVVAALAIYPYAAWMNSVASLRASFLMALPSAVRLPIHFVIAFLPCAFMMGAATTLAVRQALQMPDGSFNRKQAGRYWALVALGNVAGTLIAGFWLMGVVRSAVMLILCSAAMVLLALASASAAGVHREVRDWVLSPVALALLIIGGYGLSFGPAGTPPQWIQPRNITTSEQSVIRFDRESRYNRVVVFGDTPTARMLTIGLDRTPHSTVDLYDPTRLYSVYVQMLAGCVDALYPDKQALDVLVIGGGGFVLPRYLAATRSQGKILVSEIDPVVTAAAWSLLGLDKADRVETVNQDGRNVVDRLIREQCSKGSCGTFDVIVGDTIADTAVPYHLVTAEFNASVKTLLKPGGVYLLHLLDRPDRGLLIGSEVLTLRERFKDVSVLRWADVQDVRGSHILLASDREMDEETVLAAVRRDHPDFQGRTLNADEIEALCSREGAVVLRDRYVPVERFVLPDILDNDQLLRTMRVKKLLTRVKDDPAWVFEQALAAVRRQSLPTADEVAVLRASAERAGRINEIVGVLEEKARVPAGLQYVQLAYAEVLSQVSRWSEAGEAYEALAARYPDEERLWVGAAAAYRSGKAYEEALRVVKAAEAYHPRSTTLDSLKAQILTAAKK